MDKNLARCVGLWLAEGDNKTSYEITFTNNCFELVKVFYRVLQDSFSPDNLRLYVYRPDSESGYSSLEGVETSLYLDERASQSYYVLRLASVELTAVWRKIVSRMKEDPDVYSFILQGFFAGEGNVYEGTRNSRRLRIAQGERNEFVEKMLDFLEIDYIFRPENRSYVITKKCNWDIFKENNICCLHPKKREKFDRIYNRFKQEHYPKGQLKEEVFKKLEKPYQTRELADIFNRSQARICDVLIELKKESKVIDYKSGSHSYWIREDMNAVIISDVKMKYLDLLKNKSLKVGEIAGNFSVSKTSAYKNLHRLQEMGLIKKIEHEWKTTETDKQVIVL